MICMLCAYLFAKALAEALALKDLLKDLKALHYALKARPQKAALI